MIPEGDDHHRSMAKVQKASDFSNLGLRCCLNKGGEGNCACGLHEHILVALSSLGRRR